VIVALIHLKNFQIFINGIFITIPNFYDTSSYSDNDFTIGADTSMASSGKTNASPEKKTLSEP
jgi:hypothetical protein